MQKKTLFKLTILFLSFFSLLSCGGDDDGGTSVPVISDFTVTSRDVLMTEFAIDWTAATIDGDQGVVYDILLDGTLLDSDLNVLTYTFLNLDAETTYNVEVVAKSNEFETSSTQTLEVTTLADPSPSAFTVTSRDVLMTEFAIDWTAATIDGDQGVVYDILLDGTLLDSDLEVLTYAFSGLDAETTYNIEVVAKSNEFETSSTQTLEVTTTANPIPSSFTVTSRDVLMTEFAIDWTAATIDGDQGVVYDILLDGTLLDSDLEVLTYAFSGLDAETTYNVEVVARSNEFETSSTQTLEVTTTANPIPSSFTATFRDVATSEFSIDWTAATIDGDQGVVYDILLDGTLVDSDLEVLTYTFTGLDAETTYNVEVIARSNEFETSSSQTVDVTTESGPLPNDFTISLNSVGTGSASISWSSLTIDGAGGVFADIYINGIQEATGITSTGWVFTNLTADTDYIVEVIARSSEYGTTLSRTIDFTTDALPTTFEVTSAALSSSSPSIIIRFTNRDLLDNIVLNNITYSNYGFAGSDGIIISLPSDEFDALSNAATKEGTANFTENGVESSITFTYTVN